MIPTRLVQNNVAKFGLMECYYQVVYIIILMTATNLLRNPRNYWVFYYKDSYETIYVIFLFLNYFSHYELYKHIFLSPAAF